MGDNQNSRATTIRIPDPERMLDAGQVGVFLADLKDFDAMNEVFQEFFAENPPARTTVGCALPEIKVEIDCIARLNSTGQVRGRRRDHSRSGEGVWLKYASVPAGWEPW
jgi:endoribonuclease L-PSP